VPLAEFESPEFQDHLQRSLRESVHQPWEVTQAVSQLAAAVVGGIAIAIVLATVQPLLIPAVLLAGVPLAYAATRNSQALYDAVRGVTPLNRERQYLQGVLTGRDEAKEVRAFDAADHLRARYDDRYRRELEALRHVSRLRTRRSLVAGLGATIITVAVLATLIVLTIQGRVSLADAAVGAVAVQQLSMRVRGVNGAVSTIQEASLFLEDYGDFLARGQRDAAPAATTAHPASAVEMSGVWFTYPGADAPALQGVDLSIDRGHVVALVGANGSGKTTIAKLVCGLYEPERGSVAWQAGATPRVGVIFQDFMRYELSARDNITLGDTTRAADDDHLAASARAASAEEFLAALPRGYDTWLSPSFEGGTDLSVGQWQRVAMARALFREAPVLVLDEPTAALDPSAERDLIAATKRLFADKAVLVISHRFANVLDADRIHVLDAGRVIESGTHDELLSLGGRYAEMYRLQVATYGVDAHD
jgi:ATP-binding cassette subfamily B protein